MSESIVDFAGLETAAATATATETPAVETTEVVTPVTETTTEPKVEVESKPQYNPDGSPKETKAEELPGTESTPQNVRQALKQLRDADPKNAGIVKELHGSYERWNAAKEIFPKGVQEMKDAKTFMDTVGGHEGFDKMQDQITAINASDELLYAGDPKLIDNIVEDLRGQGRLDALGKMAPAFLDALKANDKAGYEKVFVPHFLQGLQDTEIPEVFKGIADALTEGGETGVAKAKRIVEVATKWLGGLQAQSEKSKADAVSPERVKLDEDRKAFQRQQEEFKTNQSKDFQKGVAREGQKSDNMTLEASLKPFLQMPFFKQGGFGKENLAPLANTIQSELLTTLTADRAYQSQMKALWGDKTPDRGKILEYHNAKVKSLSDDIVRNVVQRMYPQYSKGGSAAGRIAAAEAKKTVETKATATAVATGKPVFVATKPKWEEIDFDKDPKQYLYIAGKAFLKNSGKLVTWRK